MSSGLKVFSGFRLLVAGSSVAATVVLWASLVQAQHLPQQFPTQETRQSQLRDRVSGAVAQVQDACRDEVRNFCSTVTPGEGRLLLCMQAHEDKISNRCEMALFDASRNVQQATRRIERVAEACWSDIRSNCGGSGSIGQCIADKHASFSQPCQAAIAATLQQQAARQSSQPVVPQRNLIGLPIYSTDGARIGEITAVEMTADGKLRAIQAEMSYVLGLGASSVLISPHDLQLRDNHVELPLRADDIRTILMQQR
jgi:PRC-barrel domain/Cysteine rich repeat